MTVSLDKTVDTGTAVSATYAEWLAVVKHVQTVVSKRPSVSVLAYALVEVSAGAVIVTATDLEVWSRRALGYLGCAGEGSMLLPVWVLGDALKGVRGAVTPAKARGEVVTVCRDASGVLSVSGFGRVLTVDEYNGVPEVDDFPSFPSVDGESFTVDADGFLSAASFAGVAASDDWTLPTLTGVKIDGWSGGLTFAATDRYRLAVTELPCDGPEGLSVILPARSLKALDVLSGVVRVFRNGDSLAFTDSTGVVVVRLLDATFPQYRSLIPEDLEARIVDRAGLLGDVQAASAVLDKREPVRMVFGPDVLTVSGSSPRSAVGCEDEYVTGFNPRFVADGLKRFTSSTVTVAGRPNRPHVFTGEYAGGRGCYLIMPVRIPS